MAAALLAGEVLYHAWGVLQDSLAALRYAYRLDYGEGIVWQQALLMFEPQMYSPSQELPFIVFHYPPLYHFLVRLLLVFHLDPLFSGRLVSSSATIASAICIAALALISIRGRPTWLQWALAFTVSLLFFCLDPVRTWGIWMRVDMLAVFLGLAATLVAAISGFGVAGTTVALLIAVATLFTKQTHLSAGLSIFAVGMICARRQTLVAAFIAGTVGLACVCVLEIATHGFIKNIIYYNINPIKWAGAISILWIERDNLPYVACMCAAALIAAIKLFDGSSIASLRRREPWSIVLYLLVIHFWLAFISTFQIIKDGASTNYFLDLMGVGCALLAIILCETAVRPARIVLFAAALALTTANTQYRRYFGERFASWTAENDRLVQKIRDSPKPVASEDMVIVLRAGKSVIFEPAIVRVLTESGAWNPSALLTMLHNHEFSMVLTANALADDAGPEVADAILSDYPVVQAATSTLRVHLPAGSGQP